MTTEEILEISRNTSSDIKRKLRQEACFGCCVCGLPIVQYHHIIPWAKEKHYRQEDMMVLCPNHHDQATKNAMPEKEQREYKSNPYNKQRNMVRGNLEIKQNYCAIGVGTVYMVGEGSCLRIDEEDLLRIDMGEKNLEISIHLYDENDNLLLFIDHNEWVSGDYLAWDIEANWQELIIRHKSRDIRLSINAKIKPAQIKCKLWKNGQSITITESELNVADKRGMSHLALVGAMINIDTKKQECGFGPYIEGGMAFMITHADPRERLIQAVAKWKEL